MLQGGSLVNPLETGSRPLTVEVSNGRVSGHSGVNRLIGAVDPRGMFGALVTTMMAGPPEMMEQERLFLTLLQQADGKLTIEDRVHLLSGETTTVILRVLPAPQHA